MSRQSRDETAVDVQEIHTAKLSPGPFTRGDDAYVEDCRQPGTSKKYTYDGVDWSFMERVATATVSAYIERKDTCMTTALENLRVGDIRGSAAVLNAWIENDGKQIENKQTPLAPAKTPSLYNAFVSRTLKEVALTRSDISPKDRMRLAMIMWKTYKHAAIK